MKGDNGNYYRFATLTGGTTEPIPALPYLVRRKTSELEHNYGMSYSKN